MKSVTNSPADKFEKTRGKGAGNSKKTQYGMINSGSGKKGGKGGYGK